MPVYLVRSGEDGPVKIGFAANITTRLSGLRTTSAEPLRLLRTINGDRSHEKWLHDYFASTRIRGEWFYFSEEMMTIVPEPSKTSFRYSFGRALHLQLVNKNIKQKELAVTVGVSKSYISRVLSGKVGVSPSQAANFATALGLNAVDSSTLVGASLSYSAGQKLVCPHCGKAYDEPKGEIK